MNSFRRRTHSAENHAFQDEVVATLEMSGLDKESTLILGGSALALMSIRRANDVDAMVQGATFNHLMSRRQTPTGLMLQPKKFTERPFLEIYTPKGYYDLDVTRSDYLKTGEVDPALDQAFLDQLSDFPNVAGYYHEPLEAIVANKQQANRRKDRRDIELIERHLRDQ